jgi:hypothetical protein
VERRPLDLIVLDVDDDASVGAAVAPPVRREADFMRSDVAG